MFPEVSADYLLLQKTQELEELESVMRKFASLYGSTVQCMWDRKEYSDAICLESIWAESPLHAQHKNLQSYVYEIQSLFRSDRLSPVDIERARRVPLKNVLGGRGPFKCPFHSERTASFYIKKHYYTCFGCGEKGDNIKLVMKLKHLDFKNAVLYLLQHE